MSRQQKILAYATGFVLGCLILLALPRRDRAPREHPWRAQTAVEGTYPMSFTDDLGRQLSLSQQPRHFISLAPSVTEILFGMGMGDHLMAVTRWCLWPEEARAMVEAGAHVGSMDQPNRETIAAYSPDLIIGMELTPPEIYSLLHHPPETVAVCLRHESMEDVLSDIATIGQITGVPGNALRLIQKLRSEREMVDSRLDAYRDQPRKRVLFLLSIGENGQPGWTPGKDAWVADLIEQAHGFNVASSLGRAWGEVSYEALLQLNPEVLIIRRSENPAEQESMERIVASLADHPVWKQVEAVRSNRVHWVPHGPLNIPGPRIMSAYEAIASAIWPQ